MTLGLAYLYCTNLTEQEKLDIDKKVRKNRLELKFAVFLSVFPIPIFPIVPMPGEPFFPLGGFNPIQIVRNAKARVESAVAKKITQVVDDCEQAYKAYKEYKVYSKMCLELAKLSKKVRKNEETNKRLNNLHEELKNCEFHAGRGAKKLDGTETIFYMRSGSKDRLFFRYLDKEEAAVEVIGESNKKEEQTVINNLKKNYE